MDGLALPHTEERGRRGDPGGDGRELDQLGFGLVIGALFAREVARFVKVDYRLLVASAYSGFVIWHGGLSGSIPLTIATEGHFMQDAIGLLPTSQTIFAPFNLLIIALLVIAIPLINRAMTPGVQDTVLLTPPEDPEPPATADESSPAEKLEHSWILSVAVGGAGLVFLVDHSSPAADSISTS